VGKLRKSISLAECQVNAEKYNWISPHQGGEDFWQTPTRKNELETEGKREVNVHSPGERGKGAPKGHH